MMSYYQDLKHESDEGDDMIVQDDIDDDNSDIKVRKSVQFTDSPSFYNYEDDEDNDDYTSNDNQYIYNEEDTNMNPNDTSEYSFQKEKDEKDDDGFSAKNQSKQIYERYDYAHDEQEDNPKVKSDSSNSSEDENLNNDSRIVKNNLNKNSSGSLVNKNNEIDAFNNEYKNDKNLRKNIDSENQKNILNNNSYQYKPSFVNSYKNNGTRSNKEQVDIYKNNKKILQKRKDLRSNEFDLHASENADLQKWLKEKDAEVKRLRKEERNKRKKLKEERKELQKEKALRMQNAELEFERWMAVKNIEMVENKKKELLCSKLNESQKKNSFDESNKVVSNISLQKCSSLGFTNNIKMTKESENNFKLSSFTSKDLINKKYSSDPNIHASNTNSEPSLDQRKEKFKKLHNIYKANDKKLDKRYVFPNDLTVYIKPNLIKNISFAE